MCSSCQHLDVAGCHRIGTQWHAGHVGFHLRSWLLRKQTMKPEVKSTACHGWTTSVLQHQPGSPAVIQKMAIATAWPGTRAGRYRASMRLWKPPRNSVFTGILKHLQLLARLLPPAHQQPFGTICTWKHLRWARSINKFPTSVERTLHLSIGAAPTS